MSSVKKLPGQLVKEKNNFTLKLNKKLYRNDVVQKALTEDKDWIEAVPMSGNYFCLKLLTSDIDDVLNWMNYLIYLNKE